MEDKRNVEDDADDAEDAKDVKLQGESIDEAPSASDASLTNTTKKSNKEARTLGEKMASPLPEKRAIGNYESTEGTVSSTNRVVDQRANERAIGSDEPAGRRDTTVVMAGDSPDASSAPPLAPTSLVQDQHYSRPGAFRVNPSHIATSGDDDDEESFYGVHNTYDDPAISNQQNDMREAIALDVTLVPETDRADSRETHGEIGRAKPISEVNFFAQPKVQLGIFVIIVLIGGGIGLTLGLRNSDDEGIDVAPTTAAPSSVPSAAPSAAPSAFAIERFRQDILPEFSQVAIQDSTSPQSKALNWLANNTELDTYENFQRLQRFALATLHYATGGENWMVSDLYTSNWLSNDDECLWVDSACIAGQYRGLGFDNSNLVGTLPDELSILTSLVFLFLDSNALSGPIPSAVGLLTKLRDLRLYQNNLTSTIPENIGLATSLEGLYLHSNTLSGSIPSTVGLLTKLLDIWLMNNILTGIIPNQLGACTKLIELRLEANFLTGPVPTAFGIFSQLSDLRLYNNLLSSTIPTQLGACTKLEILHLDNNALTGLIPSTLGLLTRLRQLALNNNTLTGSVPAEVCQLVRTNNLTVQIDCALVECDCGCACAFDTVFDRSFEE
jgi:hypothetical protein